MKRDRATASEPRLNMSSSAIYVYCAVKASRAPSTANAPAGVPQGSPPQALDMSGSLWLIASDVPLAVYGPEALEPTLRDLDWVARVAVAHESVVEHFASAENGAVVPMKLFTMFSSRSRAIQDVGRRRRAIHATMKRIEGCEEWGLRITRARQAAAPAADPPFSRSDASRGAGAAFLASRKAARDAAQNARRAAAAAAADVFSRLSAVARDARQRPSSNEAGTNPPILEAAFLVPARARTRFSAEAQRQSALCAAAGTQMTLSGPWPAYNFVASENEPE